MVEYDAQIQELQQLLNTNTSIQTVTDPDLIGEIIKRLKNDMKNRNLRRIISNFCSFRIAMSIAKTCMTDADIDLLFPLNS
jgi:lipid II:glycine glycyltransferase (peptidoglycan interpeptide bridge formation enzyme)